MSQGGISYAALVLRRRREKEKRIYRELFPYSAEDYEVLLRYWPEEPYLNYLTAICSPANTGDSPEIALMKRVFEWSKELAREAGYPDQGVIRGIKGVFLTVTGQSAFPGLPQGDTYLSYIIPTKCKESHVEACFPTDTTEYCHFFSLQTLLHGMYTGTMSIHPSTREMLAALDNWLGERHTQSNAINQLFQPPLSQRTVYTVTNPLHSSESSELFENYWKKFEEEKVDKYVDNPLFGSGLKFKDTPEIHIENEYFGMGIPDYASIGRRTQPWALSNGADWVDEFPLHKFACEGNVDGIRAYLSQGIQFDPNSLDDDGWAPLHYACWHGELNVVSCLIEECMADIGVLNDTKSTPLHVAAGNGHRYIVEYLLGCPGINLEALDEEGRSPLTVCMENKSNEWRTTAHLLTTAAQLQSQENVDTPRINKRRSTIQVELEEISDLIEAEQPPPLVIAHEEVIQEEEEEEEEEEEIGEVVDEQLEIRGSLANIVDGDDGLPKKSVTIRKVDISFMNGHHQVANFYKGKATPASVALQDTCKLIHLDYTYHYVFALWIVSKSFALQLGDTDKPLKLIEMWPTLMSKFCKVDYNETPHLYLRRNVFLAVSRERSVSDGVTLQYLYFDALNHVLSGYYPTTEDEALQLAAITMKLKYGDFNPDIHNTKFMKDRLTTLLPAPLTKGKKRQQFEKRLLVKYEFDTLRESGNLMLYNSYLEICRKWPYYGSSFYEGSVNIKVLRATSETYQTRSMRKVQARIGINALGFHFINKESNIPMSSYPLDAMKWEMTGDKRTFKLETRDNSLQITVQSKQAPLLYSMATQMKNELDTVKIILGRQQF